MFSASHERELKFVLLHKNDLSQIRYVRICAQENKEVPWKDIVKGYEYEKGEYVILTQEDFEKANLKKTQTIEIIEFTHENEIDSLYFTKPYYLEPEKGASKAYGLLRDALKKSKKVGIARYVLHNHEHIAIIKPYQDVLVLNQLRYSDEISSIDEIVIPSDKASPKELEIALQLIEQMTASFTPESFKDTYTEELKAVIEQKAKGKTVQTEGKRASKAKIHDIMSLLKESLKQSAKPAKSNKKSKKAG